MAKQKQKDTKDVPTFTSVITTLSKAKAELIGAAQVSKVEAQKVLAAEATEIDHAIRVLADASPEIATEAVEPKERAKLVPSKDFDLAIKNIKPARLQEIAEQITSIPKISKTGVLDIPEIEKEVIYLHGKANEIYVKVKKDEDE